MAAPGRNSIANPAPESIVEAVSLSVANRRLIAGGVTGLFGNWNSMTGVIVAVLGLIISSYWDSEPTETKDLGCSFQMTTTPSGVPT